MSSAPDRPGPVTERPRRRWLLAAPLLLMVLGAVIVVLTHRDYGITWDEGMQAQYGEQAVDYFRDGFVVPEHMNRSIIRYCGPLFEMIPVLFYRAGGFDTYETRHLFLALAALLVIPGLALYARRGGDPWMPIFAAVALMMMPRFDGHMFNNSKDGPFAMTTVWFMWAAGGLLVERDFRLRRFIICGVTLGLALCARPGGLPLLGGIFIAGGLLLAMRRRPRLPRATEPLPVRAAAVAGLKLLVMLLIAWALMIAPWPWAHENIIAHPIRAMKAATQFSVPVEMLFEGRIIASDALPWHYLLKYMLITIPPALLLLAAAGIVVAAVELARHWRSRRASLAGLTLLWLLLPMAGFIVLRPHAYDGMRHFLFLLPAVAVLAALGAAGAISAFRGRARWLAWPVVVVLLLAPVRDIVQLHPYQSTYFNVFAGGLAGAAGAYETDYWINSYREAMGWINGQAARRPQRRFSVLVGGDRSLRHAASHYAAANVDVEFASRRGDRGALPAGVDYYLSTTRADADAAFPEATIVHEIGRRGAVFCVIKGRQR